MNHGQPDVLCHELEDVALAGLATRIAQDGPPPGLREG
jgi:hypothetical protein